MQRPFYFDALNFFVGLKGKLSLFNAFKMGREQDIAILFVLDGHILFEEERLMHEQSF